MRKYLVPTIFTPKNRLQNLHYVFKKAQIQIAFNGQQEKLSSIEDTCFVDDKGDLCTV